MPIVSDAASVRWRGRSGYAIGVRPTETIRKTADAHLDPLLLEIPDRLARLRAQPLADDDEPEHPRPVRPAALADRDDAAPLRRLLVRARLERAELEQLGRADDELLVGEHERAPLR